MSLRPQLEAIIYAAETPISLDQILSLLKESMLAETPGVDPAELKSRLRATLEELIADYSGSDHGIEIRQVAGGYRMSTKPDQHDVGVTFGTLQQFAIHADMVVFGIGLGAKFPDDVAVDHDAPRSD